MKQIYFETQSGSPNSEAWHAWRANGIGGSDSVAIAAHANIVTPPAWIKSLDELFAIKVGKAQTPPPNAAMIRGTEGEGPAREAFERATGIPVSPAFGEMDEMPFIRSSFDGLSFDGRLIVEIKCPNPRVHALAQKGKVVEYYLPQLAHQALTAWGHPDAWTPDCEIRFASYVPENGDIAIIEVSPQASLKEMGVALIRAELEFWQRVERFRSGAEDAAVPKDAIEAASRYLRAHKAMESAKADLESCRALLLGAIPANMKIWTGGGVVVTRSTRAGAVDYAKLLKHFGISQESADGFRKKDSEVTVVKVVGEEGEH